jgi:hypothetical protein
MARLPACACKGRGGGTCTALAGGFVWTLLERGEDITFHDWGDVSVHLSAGIHSRI